MRCAKCGKELSEDSFYKGYKSCIECTEYRKKWRVSKTLDKHIKTFGLNNLDDKTKVEKKVNKKLKDKNKRICSICGKTKSFNQFIKMRKNEKTGTQHYFPFCKQCHLDKSRQNYKKNREKLVEYQRKFRKNYPHISRQYVINTCQNAGFQSCKDYNHLKYKENINYFYKREGEKFGLTEHYTEKEVQELYKKQSGKCSCGYKFNDDYFRQHIIPMSKGGKNTIDNIRLSCKKCFYKTQKCCNKKERVL